MPLTFQQLCEAVKDARATAEVADRFADDLAALLLGRCRQVNGWNLRRLKKELSNYNARTGRWKP